MAVEDPTAPPPRPHPANRLPRGGVVVIRRGLDLDLVQTHRQMKKPGGEHDPSHKADNPTSVHPPPPFRRATPMPPRGRMPLPNRPGTPAAPA